MKIIFSITGHNVLSEELESITKSKTKEENKKEIQRITDGCEMLFKEHFIDADEPYELNIDIRIED